MTSRRAFLGSLPFAARASAAASRPNVVVFMTDDHGAWASGTYGCSEMVTPNMDALAKGGAKFTRAFAATPVCSPSRMTYLTGKLPWHHGVQNFLQPVDSFGAEARRWLDGHTTYPKLLADAGYRTGMCGKWHMGEDDKAQEGFSYWSTVPGGGGTFKNAKFVRNGRTIQTEGFKEDFIGDSAIDFLSREDSRPFFLLVPFYAPHTPYDYQPEADRAPYANAKFSCFPRDPVHPWANALLKRHHLHEESMRGYSALITAMDRNVGRVLRRIDELGARADTTVVFTADQGWNAGHHGFWGKGNGTLPFNMYEESIRVPMIWNHAGRIGAGRVETSMVSSYDFFPTILDWCGVKAPEDRLRPGRSYAPILRGERTRWTNRLYFEYAMTRAVRTDTAKYVERTKEWPGEYYDLERDPGEKSNRIDDPKSAKAVETLRKDLRAWFERNGVGSIEEWQNTTRQRIALPSR